MANSTTNNAATATINARIRDIQEQLRAPKEQTSEEGWSFRSAEDIIKRLRPHLKRHGLQLRFREKPETVGGWVYIVCTLAVMDDSGNSVAVETAVRESPAEVNRSSSQITGSCISYAHKVALNDMFALDSTGDSDMEDPDRSQHSVYGMPGPAPRPSCQEVDPRPVLNEGNPVWAEEVSRIKGTPESREAIRTRICTSYRITRDDFRRLLSAGGRSDA